MTYTLYKYYSKITRGGGLLPSPFEREDGHREGRTLAHGHTAGKTEQGRAADTEPTLSTTAPAPRVAPEKSILLLALKNQHQHQPARFSVFHRLCLT